MFRRLSGVATAVVLASTVLLAPSVPASSEPAPSKPSPRLIGGTPVPGTLNALGIMWSTSDFFYTCTAAPIESRVLLTAAHCVSVDNFGSVVSPGSIQLTPLGASLRVSGANLVEASPARVTQIFIPPGFTSPDQRVPANDIAFLVLDRDIGPSPYARLATRVEIDRWTRERRLVDAVGYGLTSPGGTASDVPRQAQLPLALIDPAYKASTGWTLFSTIAGGVNICSGDSGGPRFTTEQGSQLLIAETAGGGCASVSGLTGAAFVPITYLDLANQALAAAGYQTIPSAPVEVKAARVSDVTTLWWSPPITSPLTVMGYQVLDATGAVLCSSLTTTCSVPTAAITSELNVRSMNAEGEGDAVVTPIATDLLPVAPAARALKKRIRIFVTAVDYPSVTSYVVRDKAGKKVCSIATTVAPTPLTCTIRATPGSNRYRVEAVTPQGTTPASRLSRAVKVRG